MLRRFTDWILGRKPHQAPGKVVDRINDTIDFSVATALDYPGHGWFIVTVDGKPTVQILMQSWQLAKLGRGLVEFAETSQVYAHDEMGRKAIEYREAIH